MREVTLADVSTTKMLEWKDVNITLDEYNSITCDVLISKSETYDMMFGLNSCLAIRASLYPTSYVIVLRLTIRKGLVNY